MNPVEASDPTASALISLRNDRDAMRVITEKLRVKEMGPADHIRTKHEVKAFVEGAGDVKSAEQLLKRARERREVNQHITIEVTQRRGQRMTE